MLTGDQVRRYSAFSMLPGATDGRVKTARFGSWPHPAAKPAARLSAMQDNCRRRSTGAGPQTRRCAAPLIFAAGHDRLARGRPCRPKDCIG